MGACADSCPNLRILKGEIQESLDGCKEIDNLRKGCLSTCPPCVHDGLAKTAKELLRRDCGKTLHS